MVGRSVAAEPEESKHGQAVSGRGSAAARGGAVFGAEGRDGSSDRSSLWHQRADAVPLARRVSGWRRGGVGQWQRSGGWSGPRDSRVEGATGTARPGDRRTDDRQPHLKKTLGPVPLSAENRGVISDALKHQETPPPRQTAVL